MLLCIYFFLYFSCPYKQNICCLCRSLHSLRFHPINLLDFALGTTGVGAAVAAIAADVSAAVCLYSVCSGFRFCFQLK